MPNIGHFILHSSAIPPLGAGDYVLEGTQTVSGGATEPYAGHLRVTSPRYRMPPDQVLSTFPPANSEGAYEAVLPQMVIKRRTLPWERVVDADRSIPWMALVLIKEGEGQLSAEVPVAQCVTPGEVLTGPNDVATGVYLGVSKTVVHAVFPSKEDLPLLAHVREVDINDTELISGDDDGFLAVVLANRLPQFDRVNCAPVRYLACLVNLEGQLDVLPKRPPLFDSVFDPGLVVQDLRATGAASIANADLKLMGTGKVATTAATVTARMAGPTMTNAPRALNQNTAGPTSARASQWAFSTQQIEEAVVSAVPSEAGRVARDQMGAAWRVGVDIAVLEPTYRFPVLAYWSFTCTGAGSFRTLMQKLDVGLLGTLPDDPKAATRVDCLPAVAGSTPPPAPPSRPLPEGTETGHIGLDYLSRRGEDLRAWYRGPATPQITERDMPDADGKLPFAHTSDQLRRVVPDGREDLSLAGAFEIGRLLALSQPSIVSGLRRWREENFGAARAAKLAELALQDVPVAPPPGTKTSDIGALVAREFVLIAAKDTVKVLAESRPLVDPGRPLKYVRDLDAVIADGFGFDAATVRKRAESVGVRDAIAEVAVPVQVEDGFGAAALDSLKAALDQSVNAVAADVLKQSGQGVIGMETNRRKRSGSDALDDLLAKVSSPAEEKP